MGRISVVVLGVLVVCVSLGQGVRAQDFNGDGFDDLAVGVPGEAGTAGGVAILRGSATGVTTSGNQLFTQGTTGVPGAPEADDNCGAALAAGDFNGDGFADLAMGCPGEDDGATNNGAVNIFYGSAGGLTVTGSQAFSFVDGGLEERCGTALVAGDFNGDGFVDLAIGCPGLEGFLDENFGPFDVGRVIVLFGSSSGLRTTGRQSLRDAVPEGFERCGTAVVAGDFNLDFAGV